MSHTHSPQQAARQALIEFAEELTLGEIHIVTDEGDLWMDPETLWEGDVYLEPYLWVDSTCRHADLSMRWAVSDPEMRNWYQGSSESDREADYGDVSLRYVPVSPEVGTHVASVVGQALREEGLDPAGFSIGGDPARRW